MSYINSHTVDWINTTVVSNYMSFQIRPSNKPPPDPGVLYIVFVNLYENRGEGERNRDLTSSLGILHLLVWYTKIMSFVVVTYGVPHAWMALAWTYSRTMKNDKCVSQLSSEGATYWVVTVARIFLQNNPVEANAKLTPPSRLTVIFLFSDLYRWSPPPCSGSSQLTW